MDVITDRAGAIATVTLNRAPSHNSMTADMFAGLLAAFREAEADDVRVIVTKAAGRSFCVGADAADLVSSTDKTLGQTFRQTFEGRQGVGTMGGEAAQSFDDLGFNRWAWEVAQIKVPMIARITGAAAGGGLGLALLHHFRFADTTAKFTTAFGRLGLGCELGCSYFLPEIVGWQRALDMMVTSRVVRADEALEIGLIDQLAEPDQLDHAVMAYADRICATPILAARAAIEARVRRRNTELLQALRLEWERQKSLWGTPEFKASVTGVLARMARAKPSVGQPTS